MSTRRSGLPRRCVGATFDQPIQSPRVGQPASPYRTPNLTNANLPYHLEDYTPNQRHQIATLDLHRIIEQTIPRQMNLFIINDPPAQVHALLRADTARLEARRTAMGSFPPTRAALAEVDEGHYRRNDSSAGLMAWLEDVDVLMAENQGAVEFNRRMWSQGGYESDENDGPDE